MSQSAVFRDNWRPWKTRCDSVGIDEGVNWKIDLEEGFDRENAEDEDDGDAARCG